MAIFFAQRALLADGWHRQVRIAVNHAGFIGSIIPDSHAQDAILLNGEVIPAIANLHSHAFQRAMAGLAEIAGDPQDSFWTWRDLMYRMVQRLTPEQVGDIAALLYIDMLKGGYSQVAEFHYLHHDPQGIPYPDHAMLQQLIVAAEIAGIGQTLLPALYSYSGFGAQTPVDGQKRFIQQTGRYLQQQVWLQNALRDKPLHNSGLCFHSLRAVSEAQMREVLSASDSSLPVHIHIAEQEKEVNDSLAWCGERPVAWLMNRFGVDKRWCLIHATHLDDNEVQRLAASGAVAGLCPTTEANLGDGLFPAVDYIAQGGRWGIGSDSQVSLSTAEELRWLEYGQRLRDRRRNRITTSTQASVGLLLWQQAAQGGMQACAIRGGEIAVGQRADWLVLRDDAWPDTVADSVLLNRWLFAGQREQIREVYVAGKAVIRDGHHAAEEACVVRFKQAMAALQ